MGSKEIPRVFTFGSSVCSLFLKTIGNLLDDGLGRFRKVKGHSPPLRPSEELDLKEKILFPTLLYKSSNAWTLGSERFSSIAQPSSPDLKRKTSTP